ncbi:hypothetical protein NBH13_05120 [Bifidobacterium sp. M3-R-103]|uniref:hypothetical protein n=1 Tax=Bifidobacterium TaxID=1678 RepID=UPI00202DCEFA|nr:MULTISPECIES: hypothetical protein [Bifidobacterium]MCM0692614.1 hypothetical protein [Bifidobacterium sp. M3-R-103]
MWSYAALSKAAKTVGGPAGLVITLVAGGVAIGAAGVVAIQKMIENNTHQEITDGTSDDDSKDKD